MFLLNSEFTERNIFLHKVMKDLCYTKINELNNYALRVFIPSGWRCDLGNPKIRRVMPNLFGHLIGEDAPFDTPIGGLGSAALMNIHYPSRCLSAKQSKAKGGWKRRLATDMRFWRCSLRHAALLRERRIDKHSLSEPLPEREAVEGKRGMKTTFSNRHEILKMLPSTRCAAQGAPLLRTFATETAAWVARWKS